MSRDWQKDMELLQKPHNDSADVATIVDGIAPYWLQYAEKWRVPYEVTCKLLERQMERADQAEAREQKLRKAIEWAIKEPSNWCDPEDALDEVMAVLRNKLASLYPKEGEA